MTEQGPSWEPLLARYRAGEHLTTEEMAHLRNNAAMATLMSADIDRNRALRSCAKLLTANDVAIGHVLQLRSGAR